MDWFRRKSWTKFDEDEFFAKLGRARKDSRAQYLKIQAIELVETEEKELINVAESLLRKMLTEFPEDCFNKSSALHILGNIYKLKENYKIALGFYKAAIEFEKVYTKIKTEAYIDYAELVVKTNEKELFDEVEKMLLEQYSGLVFMIQKYKVNSILSVINGSKGNKELAKQYAESAEQFAIAKTSDFKYHKYLGIVNERDSWMDERTQNNADKSPKK